MSYLHKYKYDIFVSYSHVNNLLELDGKPWVKRFVEKLQILLMNILPENGKDLSIYFAEGGSLRQGAQVVSCRDDAEKSAVFLIMGSPRYLDDWPTSELRAFAKNAGYLERIFVAEIRPLEPPQSYPSTIGDPLRAPFWTKTDRAAPLPFQESRGEFDTRLTNLAEVVKDRLVALREFDQQPSGQGVSNPHYKTVLLTRVTEDLEDKNAALRAYLKQFDIKVLPQGEFQEEGDAFRDEFAAQLEETAIVVQLLGEHPARRTRALPDGYDGFQDQTTRAAPDKALLQWRGDLDVESIVDARHHALLTGAAAMSFEDFKDLVAKLARTPSKPPPPPPEQPSNGFIFIDADPVDAETAKKVLHACREQHLIAMMPDYTADTFKDWRENYAEASKIAIVYEKSNTQWLKAQLKLFLKTSAKRKSNINCVIYLGPPPPKSPDDVPVTHPSFTYVDDPVGDLSRLYEKLF